MIQDIRLSPTPETPRAEMPRRWSPLRQPAPAGGTAAVTAASASRDVSASLSITTRDGDTFSLSASFDTTATYAGVRTPGLQAGVTSVSGSSQVSVQVQGELSRQEMKDISRVVRTFLHDLRAILKGHAATVTNVAAGEPRTLQDVSATATTSTTLTAVAGGIRVSPPESPLPPTPVSPTLGA